MQTEEILKMLDTEIARLKRARDLLVEVQAAPGLPGTKTKRAAKTSAPVAVKRGMSAEGKARIAAAQKRRWAAQRKAAAVAAKAPAKKMPVKKTAATKRMAKKTSDKQAAPVAAPVETAPAA